MGAFADAVHPRGVQDYRMFIDPIRTVMPFYEESDPLRPGQYRIDAETKRYVRLIAPRFQNVDDLADDEPYMPWLVEDVLTGQGYYRLESKLWGDPPAPEMVVLAWATEEHPQIEISGD